QIPGVHKTDPLLKPGSKWRHDVPIEPSWIFVSERPDLYGLAVVQNRLYFKRDEFVCHDAIFFTERQRAALFDLPTDELSLLKFYTLG
ncbi:hypothetical protein CKF46_35410, partial [Klebsiella pneumoniae]